jgi:glycosyltransferase involved in cell wall biosynthesis
VIAGRDSQGHQAEVEAWLREAGVLERTTFTGMITGAEKLAAFRDADLFVLSSYTENFGISVVEAMACGLPVLVSDRVALWGEVVDGGAGRVAPCDPDAFADAMLEMLGDGAGRAAWGRRGIEVVRARFNWDAIGEQQERAYRAVVGDPEATMAERAASAV